MRQRHPTWGGKKLLVLLHKRHPRWELPARSTVCDILSRHCMIPKQRHRRFIGHPGKPSSMILGPKDLWCADYKGQFKTGDGRYCYPLTVTDGFSRYLLGCHGLHSTSVAEPNRCLPGGSKNMACPSGYAPTTGCLSPPTPWLGSQRFRHGGCAWA